MDESDVEMEDIENHPRDSGSHVKESENNSKKENSPPATVVVDDEQIIGNGGEDHNLSRNESKDNKVMSLMEYQISPNSEASDPMIAEGSVVEQISTKSKDEEIINSKTHIMTEAVEQNPANCGLKEEKRTKKGMDLVNHANNVEDKLSQCKAKKPNEFGMADANPAGHVSVEQKAAEIVDAGEYYVENRQLPNKPSAIVEELRATENVNTVSNCGEHRELMNKSLASAVEQKATEIVDDDNNSSENKQLPSNSSSIEAPLSQKYNEDEEMKEVSNVNEGKEIKDEVNEQSKEAAVTDGNTKKVDPVAKHAGDDASFSIQQEIVKTIFTKAMLPLVAEDDDGTPEEQATFMKELESFHQERGMGFIPLKFYGEPLNFLKLWRSVIRLGGYDQHFLEYERHKTQSGELQLPGVMPPEPEASGADCERNGHQGSVSERARRDAASLSMHGSNSQHHSGHSGAGEPSIKDKNPSNMAIREKNTKSICIGSIKQKRPNDADHSTKAAQTETSKQLLTPVFDVGPTADWVKINVWATKDGFEVYGLVPGLLREEVRVQANPAGCLVIVGQPQQINNSWGVSPFKKIVGFPARINPRRTSAFISLHGRLFVRIPLEQSKKSS